MEGTGFNILPHEPEIIDEELPLPIATPMKETTKRNKRFEECVLPNELSSSTLLSSSSQDHSGSVASRDTHFGQSWDGSRSRHTSNSSEEGLLQDYVVISTDELPTEGCTADQQTKKQTYRFKKLFSTRFCSPKSAKLFKLHKGRETNKYHTANTRDQRNAYDSASTTENSPIGNRMEVCASKVARVPPVGKEKEEPELSSSFFSEETGEQ
jgi:hypothetical protein